MFNGTVCFREPCSNWVSRDAFKLYLLTIQTNKQIRLKVAVYSHYVFVLFIWNGIHTDDPVLVAHSPDVVSLLVQELITMFKNLQTCFDVSQQTEKKHEGRRASAVARSKRSEFIKKEWWPPREEQNCSICYSADGTGLYLSPLYESGSAFYPIKKFGN